MVAIILAMVNEKGEDEEVVDFVIGIIGVGLFVKLFL